MVDLCRSTGKTKKEYEKIRDAIYKEYDSFDQDEQEVLSDALEELEMTIEWMN